jgi:hypothetical protein
MARVRHTTSLMEDEGSQSNPEVKSPLPATIDVEASSSSSSESGKISDQDRSATS